MSFLQIPIGTYPNTFLGYESSIDITTGIDNTAFGFNTLERLRTGSANSAFGHKALGNLTTGTNNTAIGYLSQEDTLTGTLNVSVGARSLLNNISGNANVAIGEFALSQTQIANQNVAIGYESGKFMTTGSKNSILGSFTGAHPLLDIRTLSNYVVLSNGDGDPLLWITPTGTVNIPGGIALTGSLSITGGTVTANNPVLSATQTWNNAAVTFTGWQLNVTDTASNAASLLMDLQVGGASRFRVQKSGAISGSSTGMGGAGAGAWFGSNGENFHLDRGTNRSPSYSFFTAGGSYQVRFNDATAFGWTSGNSDASLDLSLFRDAANTLAQRNGVNAQTLRVYNTFTDASNYERGFLNWSANALRIGTEGLGTGVGTNLHLDFVVTGAQRFRIPAGSAANIIEGFSSSTAATYLVLKNGGGDLFFGRDSASGAVFGGVYDGAIWMSGAQNFVLQSNGAVRFVVPPLGGFVVGPRAGVNGALATNATDGFLYVPGCAGTPTGTPSAWTGRVPIVVDTTNNKLYFYSGGAWRDAGP